jgi:L-2-hydroxycarboxylate dehydrogenase (NAD+)
MTRMDAILRTLKASPPAPGNDRVLVPGEIELGHESLNREHGVPLAAPIAAQLAALGDELAVPFPLPLTLSHDSESATA